MRRSQFQRRAVLQAFAGSAAAVSLARPDALSAQGLVAATLVVLLLDRDGAGAGETRADAALTARAVAAFTGKNIPIGLARVTGEGPRTLPGSDPPEPVLWNAEAITIKRYFQARKLTAARTRLAADLTDDAAPRIVAAPDPVKAMALSGLSAAGLRCAYLVPDESGPAWIESHPSRVVASRGGHVARAGNEAAAMDYLAEAAGDPKQTHATLFVDLSGPPEGVLALADALAKEVAKRIDRGHLVPLAPGEIGARHAHGFERLIGLRLDPPPGNGGDAPGLTGLAEALTAAAIAFSVARDDPAALAPGDCLRLDAAALARGVPAAARGWTCATVEPADPNAAPVLAAAGIESATGAGPAGFRGIDGNGLLHLGPVIAASRAEEIDALPARLHLCEDAVLTIDTTALALPVQRNAVLAALRRLAELAGTRIVDLAEFTRLVGAADPVFETMRSTRAMAPEIAARPAAPLTTATRAALMADARRAWAYFEAVTHDETGLPATTVSFAADGRPVTRHELLTQWDSGSAIFGWIAAYRLGLISSAAFDAWRPKLLATLEAATLGGPRLPRAIFYADAPWRGSPDFNICDTGRLLSALKALDRFSPEDDTSVRDLVAGWDLAAVVIDGVPHSISRGQLRPGPDAHCTSYIKRALALWGFESVSKYDVYDLGQTEADAWMHLLDEIADIGTFGAEPLLQEALEFGFDAPGLVLRDMLMAAQLTEWRATGKLVAPSEGPMDRPPWFTYQGLRIDREGPSRWDVISLTPGGETPTDAFRAAARMVTAKAPFLWAAAHPHAYSDRLVDYARAHGQMVSGFVSGVYTATDTPTLNYGDVNTNGVILEAISALLGVPARP